MAIRLSRTLPTDPQHDPQRADPQRATVQDFVPHTAGKAAIRLLLPAEHATGEGESASEAMRPHVGHARSLVTFDVLVRLLRARGVVLDVSAGRLLADGAEGDDFDDGGADDAALARVLDVGGALGCLPLVDDGTATDRRKGKGRKRRAPKSNANANANANERPEHEDGDDALDLVFVHRESATPLEGDEDTFVVSGGPVASDATAFGRKGTVRVSDVLGRNDAEALRAYLLGARTHEELTLVAEMRDGRVVFPAIDEAERRVEYLYATREALLRVANGEAPTKNNILQGQQTVVDEAPPRILAALANDLDTPAALAILAELGKAANEIVMHAPKLRDAPATERAVKQLAARTALVLRHAAAPLGLLAKTGEEFENEAKARRVRLRKLDARVIDAKVRERVSARETKDYERADALRKELTALGVEVFDGDGSSTWRVQI